MISASARPNTRPLKTPTSYGRCGCIAREARTTSRSPTAGGRGCTTLASGSRKSSTSSTFATCSPRPAGCKPGTGPRAARHLQRILFVPARPRRAPRRAVQQRLPHRRSGFRADPMGLEGPAATNAVGRAGAEKLVRGRQRVRGSHRLCPAACCATDRRPIAWRPLTAFLLAFPALFSIVNPIGGAFIFNEVTAEYSHADRVRVSRPHRRLCALHHARRALGRCVHPELFRHHARRAARRGRRRRGATGVGVAYRPGAREVRKQAQANARPPVLFDMAFFPLTMPFTTGPGTIAVAITLGSERPRTRGVCWLLHRQSAPRRSPMAATDLAALSLRRPDLQPNGCFRAAHDFAHERLPAAMHWCADHGDGIRRRRYVVPGECAAGSVS